MLKWRLVSAAVIISVAVAFIYLDVRLSEIPGIGLVPFGLLVVFLGTQEMIGFVESRYEPVYRNSVYTCGQLVFLAGAFPLIWSWFADYPPDCPIGRAGWLAIGVAVSMLILCAQEMRNFGSQTTRVIPRLGLNILVVLYPAFLLAFTALLRQWHDHAWGLTALISTVAIVKLSDVGAYFGGRTFGRRKLAPVLSPGKTYAGAVSGLIAAGLASWLFFQWIAPAAFGIELPSELSTWRLVAYGVVIAVAGMFGDLLESLLKRDVEKKDSSTWLPGLGGILDTIDSILGAAPAAYACWVSGLVFATNP